MTTLDLVTAVASTATAVGVLIAVAQLWHAEKLAAAEFEDEIRREYRQLCGDLPVKVFLGDELTEDELEDALGDFHRYFHLSSSQIFLREQGRISAATWKMWANGIAGNFELPGFRQAWDLMNSRASKHRLGRLERFLNGDEPDPRKRRKTPVATSPPRPSE
ncbi:MAG: hypothetical protein ACI8UO_000590 [Verrucomicrobiales bacterium]|jgi:hypothetical protein